MKRICSILLIVSLCHCSLKNQGEIEQTVNIYGKNDSIINSYSTIVTINKNEYIYSNSNSTNSDVNVNDLFQVSSDSLAFFDYDTFRLIKKTVNKMNELIEYKMIHDDTYILFNNEVGIIQISSEYGKTDFGTKINKNLK